MIVSSFRKWIKCHCCGSLSITKVGYMIYPIVSIPNLKLSKESLGTTTPTHPSSTQECHPSKKNEKESGLRSNLVPNWNKTKKIIWGMKQKLHVRHAIKHLDLKSLVKIPKSWKIHFQSTCFPCPWVPSSTEKAKYFRRGFCRGSWETNLKHHGELMFVSLTYNLRLMSCFRMLAQ